MKNCVTQNVWICLDKKKCKLSCFLRSVSLLIYKNGLALFQHGLYWRSYDTRYPAWTGCPVTSRVSLSPCFVCLSFWSFLPVPTTNIVCTTYRVEPDCQCLLAWVSRTNLSKNQYRSLDRVSPSFRSFITLLTTDSVHIAYWPERDRQCQFRRWIERVEHITYREGNHQRQFRLRPNRNFIDTRQE